MTAWASTGLKGLDEILCDLKKGDNVVWQVDSIEDYSHFVMPYIDKALEDKRKIVYMRFAQHKLLIENQPDVTVYQLDAKGGFESFSWSKIDDLVFLFENSHFIVIERSSFEYPWVGQQLCFKKGSPIQ